MLAQTPQIFISYARVNARFANNLERALSYWGGHPWIDRQQLGGGQDWPQSLQTALAASRAVVVVLTPAALRSPMVRREYTYALAHDIPVVLVRFTQTGPLPPELASLPMVVYRGIKGPAALYMLLAEHGLVASPPADALNMLDPAPIFAMYSQRIAADWRVMQLPRAVSWRIVVVYVVSFLVATTLCLVLPQVFVDLLGTVSILLDFALILGFGGMFVSVGFLPLLQIGVLRGTLPPDTVICMPDRCIAQIFTIERRQLNLLPQRYLYRFVQQVQTRQDRRGRVIVTFIAATGGQSARIVLPRRWPARHALAQQIADEVAAYHAAHSVATNASAPTVMGAPRAVALPPQATTYCLIAEQSERHLVQRVHRWMTQRALWPDETSQIVDTRPVMVPTALGAARCGCVLVVVTPTLLQMPQVQVMLADLRQRGKLIIPLRTTPLVTLPAALAGIQWIDFSKTSDPARGFLDLCDTLDRAGISLASPGGTFDSELILARALHQRTPPDWSVVRPDTVDGIRYRTYQVRGVFAWIVAAIGAAFLVAVLISSAQTTLATEDPATALVARVITDLIFGALYLWWLSWYAPVMNRVRFFGRALRGYYAPECVVVTPAGIAYRVIGRRGSDFMTGGVHFAQLCAVEPHYGAGGHISLRLVPVRGKVVTLPLVFFGSVIDEAFKKSVQAFAVWSAAHQPPTTASR